MMHDKKMLQDFIEWDITNWSQALEFWESKVDLDNKNFKCLELGGRRGGLSLWLALKGNDVICSDLTNPHEEASIIHCKYPQAARIEYEAIDATNIPYQNQFDIISFKSILGGISRDGRDEMKKVVLAEIYKALKPGGRLLFAENLSASALHRFLRKRLVRWGDSWNYLQIDDVESLFYKFELSYETRGFLGAFGRTEWQRRLLGGIDRIIDKLANPSSRYIIYGIATKPLH